MNYCQFIIIRIDWIKKYKICTFDKPYNCMKCELHFGNNATKLILIAFNRKFSTLNWSEFLLVRKIQNRYTIQLLLWKENTKQSFYNYWNIQIMDSTQKWQMKVTFTAESYRFWDSLRSCHHWKAFALFSIPSRKH